MKLFVQEYGEGFPLILLHGLLGSSDNWVSIGRRLAAQFRVLIPDQRNHGRSPHSPQFSYAALADDILNLLNDRHLRRAHVLGHSMGGKAAMTFALQHPEMVQTLVVVDIAPRSYRSHHDFIFEALSGLDLTRFTSRAEVDEALSAEIKNPAIRQFVMKNLKRTETNRFEWKMNLAVIRQQYDNLNAPVSSPTQFRGKTLFLRGSQSDYIQNSDIPPILALFPNAKIVDVDTGHWIHAEAPEQFSKILVDFLSEPS